MYDLTMEFVTSRTIALSIRTIHGRLGSSARTDTFELARNVLIVRTE